MSTTAEIAPTIRLAPSFNRGRGLQVGGAANPSGGRVPPTTVFLPKEHGSWSLALEPLVLGALVAPSWAGGALAGAALAGFFARRPLKAAFDGTPSLRRVIARETLVMWTALAVAGAFIVLVLAPVTSLWPLAPAALLGGAFAWCDAQGESRAASAEVAGSAAFAFLPAVFATLAGWPGWTAAALAGLALARSVPTVLTVRCVLRRAKGGRADFALPVTAALVAAAGVATLATLHLIPVWTLVPAALLAVRTLWLASPWRPAWSARQIGIFEALLGLLYVGAIAAAYGAGAHAAS